MHRISFAPELSATLRRVSCWITLLGLLHDLEQAPPLLLGDGARLGDADQVADAALILLVVDLELRALADGLAVEAVRLGRADLDDDRLVHLVRDHGGKADLPLAAVLVLGLFGLYCGVGHEVSSVLSAFLRVRLGFSSFFSVGAAATGTSSCSTGTEARMPKSRSCSTVMIRALSCRTFEIWLEFSSWTAACLKPRSKTPCRA